MTKPQRIHRIVNAIVGPNITGRTLIDNLVANGCLVSRRHAVTDGLIRSAIRDSIRLNELANQRKAIS